MACRSCKKKKDNCPRTPQEAQSIVEDEFGNDMNAKVPPPNIRQVSRSEFETAYVRVGGRKEDAAYVGGFYDPRTEDLWIPKDASSQVMLHESLHHYASRSGMRQVPTSFHEAATEHLTKTQCSKRVESGYDDGVKDIERTFTGPRGEEALRDLYFNGDSTKAREFLKSKGLDYDAYMADFDKQHGGEVLQPADPPAPPPATPSNDLAPNEQNG